MNSLLFPLSRYKILTFVLILLSALLIVGQSILTDASSYVLWSNWVLSGLLSIGIWYIMGRFHLGGVSEGKALAITWPLMSVSQNFAYLYFSPTYPEIFSMLQVMALMGVITLALSTWQSEQSTLRNLGIGVLIGLASSFFPHAVLWLLLVPFMTFHMRSYSSRNVFSIITGALLAIFTLYNLRYIIQGPEAAEAQLLNYMDIIDISDYLTTLYSFTLWHWLYLSLMVLLVVVYSISAMLLGTGHSLRASSSILLLSTLSIAEVVFLILDLGHTSLYISQLTLFLCIQLTVHQSNLRSSANEWWTLLIIVTGIVISILPFVYEF